MQLISFLQNPQSSACSGLLIIPRISDLTEAVKLKSSFYLSISEHANAPYCFSTKKSVNFFIRSKQNLFFRYPLKFHFSTMITANNMVAEWRVQWLRITVKDLYKKTALPFIYIVKLKKKQLKNWIFLSIIIWEEKLFVSLNDLL